MTNGRSQFLLICGVACVLLIINFFLEYRSIVSSQGEFFRDESLDLMTNPGPECGGMLSRGGGVVLVCLDFFLEDKFFFSSEIGFA